MLKKLLDGVKNRTEDATIKKVKESLINAAEKNGIEINELFTPAIDEKFDALARTILKEHGYAKLAKMGLMTWL